MSEILPMLVLAGQSVRFLAQSARRFGCPALALDAYADVDTGAAALWMLQVPMASAEAFEQALQHPECGAIDGGILVAGAGFEGAGAVLRRLDGRLRLAGNAPRVWDQVDDPSGFSALLCELRIPHPAVQTMPPKNPAGWLFKRTGSSGGMGVHPAFGAEGPGYFQRQVHGRAASVLFVANGHDAQVLGQHRLLQVALPGRPFAYAGAVTDPTMAPARQRRLARWVQRLTRALGLQGVNGLDLILGAQQTWCLELNPRPTATLELYEADLPRGGLGLHLAACDGTLPERLPKPGCVRGQRVVYARTPVVVPEDRWPVWASDRPAAGSRVAANSPLCTVHAEGATQVQVIRGLAWRAAQILAQTVAQRSHAA